MSNTGQGDERPIDNNPTHASVDVLLEAVRTGGVSSDKPEAVQIMQDVVALVLRLRRTPMPLADVIPHLHKMNNCIARQHEEIDRLRHEVEMLTKAGVGELAVRNPSVAEFETWFQWAHPDAGEDYPAFKEALHRAWCAGKDSREAKP